MRNPENTSPIETAVAAQPEQAFHALRGNKERDILAQFTPEQQAEIKRKQQVLSSLAYFIGKDFRIPVELNEPGQGWHWDFKENIIRIDPQDLLEKSMDYLRFVICHEGGHRRITRADFIPLEEWRQPGFSFMMNAIEDPRMNNFVAESYPKFREQMAFAYQQDLNFETVAKDKANEKLGYQPKFMQAGFEYIKQWFRETKNEDFELSADLPQEVRDVVSSTLLAAQDSWLRYPSKAEADSSEELVTQYAKVSYTINRDQVWPEFKKLVEQDIQDQQVQELMQEAQAPTPGGGSGQGIPQELKDKLTPEEQEQLEQAMAEAIEKGAGKPQLGEGQPSPDGQPQASPVSLDSLSEELKKKILDYIESLPEEAKEALLAKAQAALREFQEQLNGRAPGKALRES